MLVAQKLAKRYGSFTALDDVSFTLPRGSVTALLGPNGAGKTTLLRILTGFHPPSSGNFTLDRLDAAQDPRALKRRIGYLPEQPPLYPELRVGEYLDFVAAIKGIPRAKRRAAIGRALEAVSLGERSRQLLGTLSKGYRQRAGLAMAILGEPDLLILDEPTSGLDPNQTMEIRETIQSLARSSTVLFSSHLLPEVEAVCDRFLVLREGRLLASASREEIRAMSKGGGYGTIRVVLGSGEAGSLAAKAREALALERVEADGNAILCSDPRLPGLTGELIRLLAVSGADIREVHPIGGGLEDFFRKLTH
ncbi:MAG: ABC transporter ATP-binding protein [Spirochaetes bacterium]|nr:ABC transporter ATP-binding protein [Spirochaetota bacterium]